MIYDIFTFYNELDLLKIRLEILNSKVDYFILIECVETFSGISKPLYYQDNKHLFNKYNHKIIHYVTTNPPKSFEDLQNRLKNNDIDKLEQNIIQNALTSPNVPIGELHWLKEFYQKESIKKSLVDLNDNDICFIGDLDEIWNPNINYSIDEDSIYKLRQKVYSGFMNLRSNELWAGTLVTKYKNIKNSVLSHLRVHSRTNYEYIENAGWHFTFMGGIDQIKLKLNAYGHQEYNNDYIKNNIQNSLNENKDVLGRNEFKFWLDESELPEYLIKNKQKYIKFFK